MTQVEIDPTVDDAERCRRLEQNAAQQAARLDHFAALAAAAPPPEAATGAALSYRELQVLEATSRGLHIAEMGADLYLSKNTIKTHLRGAYRKIGATDRVQAFAWWYSHPEAAAALRRADQSVTQ